MEALAAEQAKLRGEEPWYRLVVGGNMPRFVRSRPRASLATILHEPADQALPGTVTGSILMMTVENLESAAGYVGYVTPQPAS